MIVFDSEPLAVMMYPPTGDVSLAVRVMTTGELIVAAFRAVMAVANEGYVVSRPEPPLVVTCAMAKLPKKGNNNRGIYLLFKG